MEKLWGWRLIIKGGEGPSNITVVMFDGPSPPFIVQTLRDGNTLRSNGD